MDINMDVRKITNGSWPTVIQITCTTLVLSEDEQEELRSKYTQFDSNPIIITLANRVVMSNGGFGKKYLLKNASNFKKALENL